MNEPRDRRAPAPVAPAWHTGLLLVWILGVALTGLLLGARGTAPPVELASRGAVYLQLALAQLVMLTYVVRVGLGRSILGRLIGRGWSSLPRATVDLAVALALATTILAMEFAAQRWTSSGGAVSAAEAVLRPRTPVERITWLALSLLVGLSEEVVYRGYLQRQLGAWSRSRCVGLLASALIFALAHGNQGLAPALRIGVYGWLLGLVAAHRRSLVPGIVAHALIDGMAALTPFPT